MPIDHLRTIADDLRRVLAGFEPDLLSGPDADDALRAFADLERLASAGKVLVAQRIESSNVWRRHGYRTAAQHIAETTGTTIGPAITTLKTARKLRKLPTATDAVREGKLSEQQTREIVEAAAAVPHIERELVEAAQQEPVNLLKLRCRRAKATADDQHERYERIRAARYFRHWTDPEGAVRFDAMLTPDAGARVVAIIATEAARRQEAAGKAGRSAHGGRRAAGESEQAFAADAFESLVVRSRSGRAGASREDEGAGDDADASGRAPAVVHVRVDRAALVRGSVADGEVCEIAGIGPVPVEVARELATDSILSVLVTDGVDVTAVGHVGRTIPAQVRRALLQRDERCVVPGCGVEHDLEIDHVRPFADGGPTTLENLARLCHWHHYLKTHKRYRLERTASGWRFESPEAWMARQRERSGEDSA